jgi:aspartyl-tRNA(Asn)/glutamyl-tRNA(Gln) amidotransferase subunit A
MPKADTFHSNAIVPLTELSITDAGAAIRDGSLTAKALTRAYLDMIDRRNPAIRAFVQPDADRALAAAARADADFAAGSDRGALQGIPFAVKDLIDVAGATVTFGAKDNAGRIAGRTATAVQRMLDAGAVPLGMVATYDLAIVGPSIDGAYPPARNPWNIDHITGGSSSGSAAAVASGMAPVALGTDTGGSVRSPAAYCGIVGLKPTFDAVPMDGVQPLAPSLDHLGALARTVQDVAQVFAVLSGTAPRDFTRGLAGVRIGYARDWNEAEGASRGVCDLLDDAVATLSLEGAGIALVTLPDIALMEAAGAVIIHAEMLETYAGNIAGAGGGMGRMAYQSIIAGAALTGEDVALARSVGARLKGEIDRVFDRCDLIVMATTLTPAPPVSDFAEGRAVWTPMRTLPFNVTGHPALSVPMGFVDGLPVGLQIVGRHGAEADILRVGAAFEAATDHAVQRPPIA